jgi:Ca-activated chloride channel family protein
MQFGNPNMLGLLLVFPAALIVFFWWSFRRRQTLMAQFIQARLLPGLVSGISTTRQKFRLGCFVLGVICIIVALARPQWGFSWQEVKVRGVDIVVAIDTSKSMLADDIAPNRLTRAKLAALELMQLARSDRLGLVAFAGSAFLQCPLTIDDAAFRQSVEALDVNIIPQGGTAVAEAIETAQTAFKEGDNHRVLVLMTDGEDHDSGALEAAQKAAQAGLRIYTIGIGTAEGELLRIKDAQGRTDYIRDEQGNVVKSHLNERLLQEIASATEGGFYLPLRGAKTIDTLYEQGLARLPKSEHQQKLVKQYEDRYHWPLGLAIVLLLTEVLVPERRRESKPNVRMVSSKVAAAGTAMLLLGLILSGNLFASPSSALREYKAGKYDEALKEYQQLLQRNADDPRLHFNAGTAAYRDQKFDEAAKQFNEAIASPDLKLQQLSYYNRGNAQYWLGEKNSDPSKRTDLWEKSVKDYELSMKLNPQDADAKFNHDFVKKRLEELKQQQQQQQKSDQNKSDQKDQNQQEQEQQQNQQSQQSQQNENQQQQQQEKQNQAKQNQQASDQNQQAKQDQQQQKAANQPDDQKQNQQQASQPSSQQKNEAGETNQQAYSAGQMTPEQARQLLDAQKGDEKMLSMKPEGKPLDRAKPIRDW